MRRATRGHGARATRPLLPPSTVGNKGQRPWATTRTPQNARDAATAGFCSTTTTSTHPPLARTPWTPPTPRSRPIAPPPRAPGDPQTSPHRPCARPSHALAPSRLQPTHTAPGTCAPPPTRRRPPAGRRCGAPCARATRSRWQTRPTSQVRAPFPARSARPEAHSRPRPLPRSAARLSVPVRAARARARPRGPRVRGRGVPRVGRGPAHARAREVRLPLRIASRVGSRRTGRH